MSATLIGFCKLPITQPLVRVTAESALRIFEFVVILPATSPKVPVTFKLPVKVNPSASLKSTFFNVTPETFDEVEFPLNINLPVPE